MPVCTGDVRYMHKVPGLTAIAKNGDIFSAQCTAEKNRNRSGIGTLWILPRAKDIKVTKAGSLQTAHRCVHRTVVLAIQLRDSIGTFRARRQ